MFILENKLFKHEMFVVRNMYIYITIQYESIEEEMSF